MSSISFHLLGWQKRESWVMSMDSGVWGFGHSPLLMAELEPLAELQQSPTLLESLEIRPPAPPIQALMQVPEGTGPW